LRGGAEAQVLGPRVVESALKAKAFARLHKYGCRELVLSVLLPILARPDVLAVVRAAREPDVEVRSVGVGMARQKADHDVLLQVAFGGEGLRRVGRGVYGVVEKRETAGFALDGRGAHGPEVDSALRVNGFGG